MKKIILIAFTLSVLTSAHSAEWYEGGGLHKATAFKWYSSSRNNKLATSADFVAAIKDSSNLKINSMNDAKRYANDLVVCVDKSIVGDDGSLMQSSRNTPVSSLAALCMTLMGWMK